MNAISRKMRRWEHCPECGALFVDFSGGVICAHCGFEEDDEDYAELYAMDSSPRHRCRRKGFYSLDDSPDGMMDEAA